MPMANAQPLPEVQSAVPRPERWLVVAPVAVLLALAVLLVLGMGVLRQRNIARAEGSIQALAAVLSEQSVRTLQTVESWLDELAQQSQAGGAPTVQAPPATLPYVLAWWWLSPQGQVLRDSDPQRLQGYRALLEYDQGAYWNAALRQSASQVLWLPSLHATAGGRWVLQATRTVRNARGEVLGVLVAAVDHQHFYRFWQKVGLGEGGSIVLMNRRGDFFLRQPLVPDAMARNWGQLPVFSTLLPQSTSGVYRGPGGCDDGGDCLLAYQASESHPDMVVIVGESVDYMLGRWRSVAGLMAGLWLLLALAVLGFSRAMLQLWQRKQQVQRQAQQQAHDLQVLSQRMLGAQEAERARIARELHDELGQLLTAIKINLQTAQHAPGALPAPEMQENVQIIDNALRQVRHLALALRPSMLDNLGLRAALQWLAKDQAQRAGWVLTLELDALERRLHCELETCFFRVAQEALTNVARHARATQVRVRLQCSDGMLHLQVQDNGVGADFTRLPPTAARESGLGLQGMRERAALVGGQLQVQGYSGQGCTVHLRCPLRYAEALP